MDKITLLFYIILINKTNSQIIHLIADGINSRNISTIKEYEFLAETPTLSHMLSFDFKINGTCGGYSAFDAPIENSILENIKHEINVLLYPGYNHNLAFMLEFKIQVPRSYITMFDGFEIKIFDYKTQTTNCIQIQSINSNAKQFESIKFILKDPTRFDSIDRNKFIFYFGKISLNVLIRSKNNIVSSEKMSSLLDVGIKSLDESARIQDYKFQEICAEVITNTCLNIINTSEEESYLLIRHPFPNTMNTILEKVGWVHPFYFNAYQNETINGIIYKVIKIQKTDKRISNYFIEPNKENKCSKNEDSKHCLCGDKCEKCYSQEDVPQTIYIDNSVNGYPGNRRCNKWPYSAVSFAAYRMINSFQNKRIDYFQEDFHLNNYLPQLCTIVTRNENYYFNYSIPSFRLTVQFNDSFFISQTSLFSLSYEITIYDTCNKTYNKIIKSNQQYTIDALISGDYIIQVIPKLKSSVCDEDMCVYALRKEEGALDDFKCEPCLKMVKYMEIKEANPSTHALSCYPLQKVNEIENKYELMLYELAVAAAQNNFTLIANKNLLLSIPMFLKTDKKCNRHLKATIVSANEDNLYAGVLITVASLLILLILVFACLHALIIYFKWQCPIQISIHVSPQRNVQHESDLKDLTDLFFKIMTSSFEQINYSMNKADYTENSIQNESEINILIINEDNHLNYAISVLQNGSNSLEIAKTKAESLFNHVLVEHHVYNTRPLILSFNEFKLCDNNRNKFQQVSSRKHIITTDLSNNKIMIFNLTSQYKKFLQYIIFEKNLKQSKLSNFITNLKIHLDLKLYFKIKNFQNNLKTFSNLYLNDADNEKASLFQTSP